MAEQYYPIPENPNFDPNIRKIQNGDYVDAEQVLGPVLQRIIENQVADHQGKVDKEEGKTLSTENYTTEEKSKLLGLGDGRRTCRFVVGTSTAGWTENDCDYLCDGVDDQEEINAAIQALPELGGKVYILDGNYNITSQITINRPNIHLCGNTSNSTTLNHDWDINKSQNSEYSGTIVVNSNVVGVCRITNLAIVGHKEVYPDSNNNGIAFRSSQNLILIVQNVTVSDFGGHGIFTYYGGHLRVLDSMFQANNQMGVRTYGIATSVFVDRNMFEEARHGIYIENVEFATISNNRIQNVTQYGIYCGGNSQKNNITVSSNQVLNSNYGIFVGYADNILGPKLVCNNIIDSATYGIYLSRGNDYSATGNIISNSKGTAITLDSDVYRSSITNNICCRGTGLPSDYYTGLETIKIYGTNTNKNLISGNLILGRNYLLEGSIGNTIVNNKFE